MALVWSLLITSVFFPLSVRRYTVASVTELARKSGPCPDRGPPLAAHACPLPLVTCAVGFAQWTPSAAEVRQGEDKVSRMLLSVQYRCLLAEEWETASLFFQLVSSRYEQATLIVTANTAFGRWARPSATTSSHQP